MYFLLAVNVEELSLPELSVAAKTSK